MPSRFVFPTRRNRAKLRWFRPIWQRAMLVWKNCSTRIIVATITPLSTVPTAVRALPSCASCLTTAPKHQWHSLQCAQHARRNIPTPLIGASMHNLMRALSAALKSAGLNQVARAVFRPKAFPGRKTSRNPTRFSTVPQSLLRKAASLPLRVWADTTWCAMLPTRRHLPHCASANIVPARRLLLWLLQWKRLALFVE